MGHASARQGLSALHALVQGFGRRVLLCAVWLLVVRLVLVLHSGIVPHPGWMLLSDAVAALLLALLLPAFRLPGLRWAFVGLAGLGLYAAGRHLGIHATHFRLTHIAHLGDPLLLGASVFDPGVLMLPGYLLLAWLLLYAARRLLPYPQPPRLHSIVVALAGISAYALVVPGVTLPANSALLSTVAQVPEQIVRIRAVPPSEPDVEVAGGEAGSDFFALRRNPLAAETSPNILLILVEGLSAAFLPEVARHHGLEPATVLPGLQTTLNRHGFRVWRNVLTMQRQTHRGTYALLCGDYPRLGQGPTKMEEIARDEADADCLPALLAERGYSTHYLQAAPLSFMRKEAFMPAVGFQESRGADFFDVDAEDTGKWGAGDAHYFGKVTQWLRDTAGQGAPWFATLLNVGTHHPYPAGQQARTGETEAPADLADEVEASSDRSIAFAAMAEALGGMLDRLDAEGVLENTVVLISSDEAGPGVRAASEALPLDRNFGFFALRVPERLQGAPLTDRDALVANLDVAATLADFGGVEDAGTLIGRSVLAHDDAPPRGLMLGETYSGQVFFLSEEGRLLVCGEALTRCTSWRFQPGRLFASLKEAPEEEPLLDPVERQQLIERTGAIGARPGARR